MQILNCSSLILKPPGPGRLRKCKFIVNATPAGWSKLSFPPPAETRPKSVTQGDKIRGVFLICAIALCCCSNASGPGAAQTSRLETHPRLEAPQETASLHRTVQRTSRNRNGDSRGHGHCRHAPAAGLWRNYGLPLWKCSAAWAAESDVSAPRAFADSGLRAVERANPDHLLPGRGGHCRPERRLLLLDALDSDWTFPRH